MSENAVAPESLVLCVEEIALPSNAQGILEVMRRVLSKPYVQSILLRTGSPIEVSWYKDISDSLDIDEPDEDPESVLSRVRLEELSSTKPSRDAYVDALLKSTTQGLQATHLFVGSTSFFKDWMGVPSVLSLPEFEGTEFLNFAGIRLLEVDSLQEDVVVLLSGPTTTNRLIDLSTAYKLTT